MSSARKFVFDRSYEILDLLHHRDPPMSDEEIRTAILMALTAMGKQGLLEDPRGLEMVGAVDVPKREESTVMWKAYHDSPTRAPITRPASAEPSPP